MRARARQGREVTQPPLDQRLLLVPPPALDLVLQDEGILDVLALLRPHQRDRAAATDVATSVAERVLFGTEIKLASAADVELIIGAFQDVDPWHLRRIRT